MNSAQNAEQKMAGTEPGTMQEVSGEGDGGGNADDGGGGGTDENETRSIRERLQTLLLRFQKRNAHLEACETALKGQLQELMGQASPDVSQPPPSFATSQAHEAAPSSWGWWRTGNAASATMWDMINFFSTGAQGGTNQPETTHHLTAPTYISNSENTHLETNSDDQQNIFNALNVQEPSGEMDTSLEEEEKDLRTKMTEIMMRTRKEKGEGADDDSELTTKDLETLCEIQELERHSSVQRKRLLEIQRRVRMVQELAPSKSGKAATPLVPAAPNMPTVCLMHGVEEMDIQRVMWDLKQVLSSLEDSPDGEECPASGDFTISMLSTPQAHRQRTSSNKISPSSDIPHQYSSSEQQKECEVEEQESELAVFNTLKETEDELERLRSHLQNVCGHYEEAHFEAQSLQEQLQRVKSSIQSLRTRSHSRCRSESRYSCVDDNAETRQMMEDKQYGVSVDRMYSADERRRGHRSQSPNHGGRRSQRRSPDWRPGSGCSRDRKSSVQPQTASLAAQLASFLDDPIAPRKVLERALSAALRDVPVGCPTREAKACLLKSLALIAKKATRGKEKAAVARLLVRVTLAETSARSPTRTSTTTDQGPKRGSGGAHGADMLDAAAAAVLELFLGVSFREALRTRAFVEILSNMPASWPSTGARDVAVATLLAMADREADAASAAEFRRVAEDVLQRKRQQQQQQQQQRSGRTIHSAPADVFHRAARSLAQIVRKRSARRRQSRKSPSMRASEGCSVDYSNVNPDMVRLAFLLRGISIRPEVAAAIYTEALRAPLVGRSMAEVKEQLMDAIARLAVGQWDRATAEELAAVLVEVSVKEPLEFMEADPEELQEATWVALESVDRVHRTASKSPDRRPRSAEKPPEETDSDFWPAGFLAIAGSDAPLIPFFRKRTASGRDVICWTQEKGTENWAELQSETESESEGESFMSAAEDDREERFPFEENETSSRLGDSKQRIMEGHPLVRGRLPSPSVLKRVAHCQNNVVSRTAYDTDTGTAEYFVSDKPSGIHYKDLSNVKMLLQNQEELYDRVTDGVGSLPRHTNACFAMGETSYPMIDVKPLNMDNEGGGVGQESKAPDQQSQCSNKSQQKSQASATRTNVGGGAAGEGKGQKWCEDPRCPKRKSRPKCTCQGVAGDHISASQPIEGAPSAFSAAPSAKSAAPPDGKQPMECDICSELCVSSFKMEAGGPSPSTHGTSEHAGGTCSPDACNAADGGTCTLPECVIGSTHSTHPVSSHATAAPSTQFSQAPSSHAGDCTPAKCPAAGDAKTCDLPTCAVTTGAPSQQGSHTSATVKGGASPQGVCPARQGGKCDPQVCPFIVGTAPGSQHTQVSQHPQGSQHTQLSQHPEGSQHTQQSQHLMPCPPTNPMGVVCPGTLPDAKDYCVRDTCPVMQQHTSVPSKEPSHHSQTPSHHSQQPSHRSQQPSHHTTPEQCPPQEGPTVCPSTQPGFTGVCGPDQCPVMQGDTRSHHSQTPSHHSQTPSHHSQTPSHHSQQPSHRSQQQSHHTTPEQCPPQGGPIVCPSTQPGFTGVCGPDQCPVMTGDTRSHHSQTPSHHSQQPSQHSQAPSHHSQQPSRQTTPEQCPPQGGPIICPSTQPGFTGVCGPDQCPVMQGDTRSHHSQTPSHHSQAPSHHSQAPSHHSQQPSRQTTPEQCPPQGGAPVCPSTQPGFTGVCAPQQCPVMQGDTRSHHSQTPSHHSQAASQPSQLPNTTPEAPPQFRDGSEKELQAQSYVSGATAKEPCGDQTCRTTRTPEKKICASQVCPKRVHQPGPQQSSRPVPSGQVALGGHVCGTCPCVEGCPNEWLQIVMPLHLLHVDAGAILKAISEKQTIAATLLSHKKMELAEDAINHITGDADMSLDYTLPDRPQPPRRPYTGFADEKIWDAGEVCHDPCKGGGENLLQIMSGSQIGEPQMPSHHSNQPSHHMDNISQHSKQPSHQSQHSKQPSHQSQHSQQGKPGVAGSVTGTRCNRCQGRLAAGADQGLRKHASEIWGSSCPCLEGCATEWLRKVIPISRCIDDAAVTLQIFNAKRAIDDKLARQSFKRAQTFANGNAIESQNYLKSGHEPYRHTGFPCTGDENSNLSTCILSGVRGPMTLSTKKEEIPQNLATKSWLREEYPFLYEETQRPSTVPSPESSFQDSTTAPPLTARSVTLSTAWTTPAPMPPPVAHCVPRDHALLGAAPLTMSTAWSTGTSYVYPAPPLPAFQSGTMSTAWVSVTPSDTPPMAATNQQQSATTASESGSERSRSTVSGSIVRCSRCKMRMAAGADNASNETRQDNPEGQNSQEEAMQNQEVTDASSTAVTTAGEQDTSNNTIQPVSLIPGGNEDMQNADNFDSQERERLSSRSHESFLRRLEVLGEIQESMAQPGDSGRDGDAVANANADATLKAPPGFGDVTTTTNTLRKSLLDSSSSDEEMSEPELGTEAECGCPPENEGLGGPLLPCCGATGSCYRLTLEKMEEIAATFSQLHGKAVSCACCEGKVGAFQRRETLPPPPPRARPIPTCAPCMPKRRSCPCKQARLELWNECVEKVRVDKLKAAGDVYLVTSGFHQPEVLPPEPALEVEVPPGLPLPPEDKEWSATVVGQQSPGDDDATSLWLQRAGDCSARMESVLEELQRKMAFRDVAAMWRSPEVFFASWLAPEPGLPRGDGVACRDMAAVEGKLAPTQCIDPIACQPQCVLASRTPSLKITDSLIGIPPKRTVEFTGSEKSAVETAPQNFSKYGSLYVANKNIVGSLLMPRNEQSELEEGSGTQPENDFKKLDDSAGVETMEEEEKQEKDESDAKDLRKNVSVELLSFSSTEKSALSTNGLTVSEIQGAPTEKMSPQEGAGMGEYLNGEMNKNQEMRRFTQEILNGTIDEAITRLSKDINASTPPIFQDEKKGEIREKGNSMISASEMRDESKYYQKGTLPAVAYSEIPWNLDPTSGRPKLVDTRNHDGQIDNGSASGEFGKARDQQTIGSDLQIQKETNDNILNKEHVAAKFKISNVNTQSQDETIPSQLGEQTETKFNESSNSGFGRKDNDVNNCGCESISEGVQERDPGFKRAKGLIEQEIPKNPDDIFHVRTQDVHMGEVEFTEGGVRKIIRRGMWEEEDTTMMKSELANTLGNVRVAIEQIQAHVHEEEQHEEEHVAVETDVSWHQKLKMQPPPGYGDEAAKLIENDDELYLLFRKIDARSNQREETDGVFMTNVCVTNWTEVERAIPDDTAAGGKEKVRAPGTIIERTVEGLMTETDNAQVEDIEHFKKSTWRETEKEIREGEEDRVTLRRTGNSEEVTGPSIHRQQDIVTDHLEDPEPRNAPFKDPVGAMDALLAKMQNTFGTLRSTKQSQENSPAVSQPVSRMKFKTPYRGHKGNSQPKSTNVYTPHPLSQPDQDRSGASAQKKAETVSSASEKMNEGGLRTILEDKQSALENSVTTTQGKTSDDSKPKDRTKTSGSVSYPSSLPEAFSYTPTSNTTVLTAVVETRQRDISPGISENIPESLDLQTFNIHPDTDNVVSNANILPHSPLKYASSESTKIAHTAKNPLCLYPEENSLYVENDLNYHNKIEKCLEKSKITKDYLNVIGSKLPPIDLNAIPSPISYTNLYEDTDNVLPSKDYCKDKVVNSSDVLHQVENKQKEITGVTNSRNTKDSLVELIGEKGLPESSPNTVVNVHETSLSMISTTNFISSIDPLIPSQKLLEFQNTFDDEVQTIHNGENLQTEKVLEVSAANTGIFGSAVHEYVKQSAPEQDNFSLLALFSVPKDESQAINILNYGETTVSHDVAANFVNPNYTDLHQKSLQETHVSKSILNKFSEISLQRTAATHALRDAIRLEEKSMSISEETNEIKQLPKQELESNSVSTQELSKESQTNKKWRVKKEEDNGRTKGMLPEKINIVLDINVTLSMPSGNSGNEAQNIRSAINGVLNSTEITKDVRQGCLNTPKYQEFCRVSDEYQIRSIIAATHKSDDAHKFTQEVTDKTQSETVNIIPLQSDGNEMEMNVTDMQSKKNMLLSYRFDNSIHDTVSRNREENIEEKSEASSSKVQHSEIACVSESVAQFSSPTLLEHPLLPVDGTLNEENISFLLTTPDCRELPKKKLQNLESEGECQEIVSNRESALCPFLDITLASNNIHHSFSDDTTGHSQQFNYDIFPTQIQDSVVMISESESRFDAHAKIHQDEFLESRLSIVSEATCNDASFDEKNAEVPVRGEDIADVFPNNRSIVSIDAKNILANTRRCELESLVSTDISESKTGDSKTAYSETVNTDNTSIGMKTKVDHNVLYPDESYLTNTGESESYSVDTCRNRKIETEIPVIYNENAEKKYETQEILLEDDQRSSCESNFIVQGARAVTENDDFKDRQVNIGETSTSLINKVYIYSEFTESSTESTQKVLDSRVLNSNSSGSQIPVTPSTTKQEFNIFKQEYKGDYGIEILENKYNCNLLKEIKSKGSLQPREDNNNNTEQPTPQTMSTEIHSYTLETSRNEENYLQYKRRKGISKVIAGLDDQRTVPDSFNEPVQKARKEVIKGTELSLVEERRSISSKNKSYEISEHDIDKSAERKDKSMDESVSEEIKTLSVKQESNPKYDSENSKPYKMPNNQGISIDESALLEKSYLELESVKQENKISDDSIKKNSCNGNVIESISNGTLEQDDIVVILEAHTHGAAQNIKHKLQNDTPAPNSAHDDKNGNRTRSGRRTLPDVKNKHNKQHETTQKDLPTNYVSRPCVKKSEAKVVPKRMIDLQKHDQFSRRRGRPCIPTCPRRLHRRVDSRAIGRKNNVPLNKSPPVVNGKPAFDYEYLPGTSSVPHQQHKITSSANQKRMACDDSAPTGHKQFIRLPDLKNQRPLTTKSVITEDTADDLKVMPIAKVASLVSWASGDSRGESSERRSLKLSLSRKEVSAWIYQGILDIIDGIVHEISKPLRPVKCSRKQQIITQHTQQVQRTLQHMTENRDIVQNFKSDEITSSTTFAQMNLHPPSFTSEYEASTNTAMEVGKISFPDQESLTTNNDSLTFSESFRVPIGNAPIYGDKYADLLTRKNPKRPSQMNTFYSSQASLAPTPHHYGSLVTEHRSVLADVEELDQRRCSTNGQVTQTDINKNMWQHETENRQSDVTQKPASSALTSRHSVSDDHTTSNYTPYSELLCKSGEYDLLDSECGCEHCLKGHKNYPESIMNCTCGESTEYESNYCEDETCQENISDAEEKCITASDAEDSYATATERDLSPIRTSSQTSNIEEKEENIDNDMEQLKLELEAHISGDNISNHPIKASESRSDHDTGLHERRRDEPFKRVYRVASPLSRPLSAPSLATTSREGTRTATPSTSAVASFAVIVGGEDAGPEDSSKHLVGITQEHDVKKPVLNPGVIGSDKETVLRFQRGPCSANREPCCSDLETVAAQLRAELLSLRERLAASTPEIETIQDASCEESAGMGAKMGKEVGLLDMEMAPADCCTLLNSLLLALDSLKTTNTESAAWATQELPPPPPPPPPPDLLPLSASSESSARERTRVPMTLTALETQGSHPVDNNVEIKQQIPIDENAPILAKKQQQEGQDNDDGGNERDLDQDNLTGMSSREMLIFAKKLFESKETTDQQIKEYRERISPWLELVSSEENNITAGEILWHARQLSTIFEETASLLSSEETREIRKKFAEIERRFSGDRGNVTQGITSPQGNISGKHSTAGRGEPFHGASTSETDHREMSSREKLIFSHQTATNVNERDAIYNRIIVHNSPCVEEETEQQMNGENQPHQQEMPESLGSRDIHTCDIPLTSEEVSPKKITSALRKTEKPYERNINSSFPEELKSLDLNLREQSQKLTPYTPLNHINVTNAQADVEVEEDSLHHISQYDSAQDILAPSSLQTYVPQKPAKKPCKRRPASYNLAVLAASHGQGRLSQREKLIFSHEKSPNTQTNPRTSNTFALHKGSEGVEKESQDSQKRGLSSGKISPNSKPPHELTPDVLSNSIIDEYKNRHGSSSTPSPHLSEDRAFKKSWLPQTCYQVFTALCAVSSFSKFISQALERSKSTSVPLKPRSQQTSIFDATTAVAPSGSSWEGMDAGSTSTRRGSAAKRRLRRHPHGAVADLLEDLGDTWWDAEGAARATDSQDVPQADLRIVDSHTTLLRWPVVAGAIGYEIFVNGRLRQKVYSGTRDMAALLDLDLQQRLHVTVYPRMYQHCGRPVLAATATHNP